jgi:O-antigen/teichoic acid export membrane protein
VPIYVKFLGVEGYGLIGVSIGVQAVFSIFDFGFSAAVLREVSKYGKAAHTDGAPLAEIIRTYEILFLAIAATSCVIGVVIFRPITAGWVPASEIIGRDMPTIIGLMFVNSSLRLLTLPYIGTLAGTQRLVWLNIVSFISVVIRGAGAIILFSGFGIVDAATFFCWQVIATFIDLVLYGVSAWSRIGGVFFSARVRWELVRKAWPFARGVCLITATGTAFVHIDKLLLPRLAGLTEFGIYAAAGVLATSIYNLVYPFSTAASPRATNLLHTERRVEASEVFLFYAHLAAACACPAVAFIAVFSLDIAKLYLHDAQLAHQVAAILPVLAIGAGATAFTPLLQIMQLAMGRTVNTIISNGLGCATLCAGLLIGFQIGLTGAALAWAGANIVAAVSLAVLTLRQLRDPAIGGRWIKHVVGFPVMWTAVGTVAAVTWTGWFPADSMARLPCALATIYLIPMIALKETRAIVCSVWTGAIGWWARRLVK